VKPAALRDAARQIEKLRESLLFGGECEDLKESEARDPETVQQFLLALALLDQAQRHMMLAYIKESKLVEDTAR
jgi:hypothetical protein